MTLDTVMKDEVRILEHCMVVPATPTIARHDQELFLSSLDLLWRPFSYPRILHFYASEEQDALIATLKESLAHVLVPFYPVAGRLALSLHHKNRVCVDCNDAGVEFVVASTDTLDLHELEAHHFQPCPLFSKLAPYHDVQTSSDIFRLPLMAVQVTKLRSGRGIVVGIAQSHVLCDAESACHFLRSWSECARKVPIAMQPLHMRWALAVEVPLVEKASLPYPPEGLSATHTTWDSSVVSKDPLMEVSFPHSREVIQKLKQAANAEHHAHRDSTTFHPKEDDNRRLGDNAQKFSSYEALCGYWWKLITRARQLDGDAVVTFGVLANMRARLTPKLPPAYFGNAIISASAYARVDEILQESLGSTAARIRQASLASSPEAMWSIIHWLELHGQAYDARFFSLAPTVKAINSPQFPWYDVDYGYGRPVAVQHAKISGDGDIVLLPSRDGGSEGGVDVFLALNIEAMKRLKEDPALAPLIPIPSKPSPGLSEM